MNHIDFLKTALKDYKVVGALSATSRYAVDRIMREITGGAPILWSMVPGMELSPNAYFLNFL